MLIYILFCGALSGMLAATAAFYAGLSILIGLLCYCTFGAVGTVLAAISATVVKDIIANRNAENVRPYQYRDAASH